MKPYKRIKFLNKKLTSLIDEKEKIDLRFIGESFWLNDDEYTRLLNESDRLNEEIQWYTDELKVLLPLLNFYRVLLISGITIVIVSGVCLLKILLS